MSDEPRDDDDEWALKPVKNRGADAPPAAAPDPPPQPRPAAHRERARRERDSSPPDSDSGSSEKRITRRLQRASGTKVAILGAMASGKSYLFQAMTYRASNPARSGSLKVFLGNEQADIYEAEQPDEAFRMLDMRAFNATYKNWGRLPSTNVAMQRWYKLLLRYKTGWFGHDEMCVDFLDGSGEAMQQKVVLMDAPVFEMFKSAYLPARVAIFCLPMWVAFPDPDQRANLEEARKKALDGFYQIVHNLKELRQDSGAKHSVQAILALTQADDRRCAMRRLRRFWIDSFVEHAADRAAELGTQRGLMRYLRDARAVSDWLLDQLQRSSKNDLQKLPFELQLGSSRLPLIVPLSAIDGSTLDLHSPPDGSTTPSPGLVFASAPTARAELRSIAGEKDDPVPVHVELPLLFALCEQHNALM